MGSLLGGFKSMKLGGFTHAPGSWTPGNGDFGGETDNPSEYTPGGINGVNGLAGAGLDMAGMALAQQGLLGSKRGTWGGIAEGTAGGAMIGFQMGGPLGAAIGAAAGFGIGVGEKIFGVKSDEQTAHDDVKSAYGVDIPSSSGVIKQIVNLAKSQFGGSISVAVRSASVRQLVMLYSEVTGQKMPLSATTPYAGSLVEQGGKLYQQASWLDGQAHIYSSNLPTLGGLQTTTYPTPTYISMNISGSDAANFMSGQYVTPQFVSDQSVAAQNSSYNRTQQAANSVLPGLTIA